MKCNPTIKPVKILVGGKIPCQTSPQWRGKDMPNPPWETLVPPLNPTHLNKELVPKSLGCPTRVTNPKPNPSPHYLTSFSNFFQPRATIIS